MNDAPFQPQQVARQRQRTFNDVARPAAHARPTQPPPRTTPAMRPPVQVTRPAPPPVPAKNAPKLLAYVQIVGIVVVAMVAGLMFQSFPLGEIAIVAYGIVALVRKIPARTTFVVALISLGLVPAAMAVNQPFLSENFATYAFTLLAVGIISVLREVRMGRKSDNAVNTTQQ